MTIADTHEGSPTGQVVNACANSSGGGFQLLAVFAVDQADNTEWIIPGHETDIHLERIPLPTQEV